MDIQKVREWKYTKLKDFVQSVRNIENDEFDFKEAVDSGNAKEIRKDFSAFANKKGGIIFIGIDNNKQIRGIKRDDQLDTKINRCLSNSALQPGIRWERLNTIRIPKTKPTKYVYIYYIRPSLCHEKPHVSDCRIFIREQGESKPISSGYQLRRLFFVSRFDPSHIDQLEYELQKIRRYEYYGNREIDVFYFRYLKQFLEESKQEKKDKGHDSTEIDKLLGQFYKIQEVMDETERLRAEIRSSTKTASLSSSESIKTKYEELMALVDDFISNFKRVYKG